MKKLLKTTLSALLTFGLIACSEQTLREKIKTTDNDTRFDIKEEELAHIIYDKLREEGYDVDLEINKNDVYVNDVYVIYFEDKEKASIGFLPYVNGDVRYIGGEYFNVNEKELEEVKVIFQNEIPKQILMLFDVDDIDKMVDEGLSKGEAIDNGIKYTVDEIPLKNGNQILTFGIGVINAR